MNNIVPQNKKIIIFDGICLLCNTAVLFVATRDTQDQFRFVSLQSPLGQDLCSQIGIDPLKINTIILYEPGKAYYIKAQAVINILTALGGLYTLIKITSLIPTPITNALYDIIAKKRYTWFGKKQSCSLPTQEIKSKFL